MSIKDQCSELYENCNKLIPEHKEQLTEIKKIKKEIDEYQAKIESSEFKDYFRQKVDKLYNNQANKGGSSNIMDNLKKIEALQNDNFSKLKNILEENKKCSSTSCCPPQILIALKSIKILPAIYIVYKNIQEHFFEKMQHDMIEIGDTSQY